MFQFVKRMVVALMSIVLVSGAYAYADGDVIVRAATADEKSFILRTQEILKQAAGKLPQGWQTNHESQVHAEDILRFVGKKEHAIEVKYEHEMNLVDGLEERQAAYDRARENTEAARVKLEALLDTVRQKGFEADKARQAGDRAGYEKAKAEMEASQKEHSQLMDAGDNPYQRMNDAELELRRDTRIRIRASANSTSEYLSGMMTPLELPGAALAERVDFIDKSRPAEALLLLGDWTLQRYGEGTHESVTARRAHADTDKLTKIYTIAIRIEADRERLPSLIAAMDMQALRALLQ